MAKTSVRMAINLPKSGLRSSNSIAEETVYKDHRHAEHSSKHDRRPMPPPPRSPARSLKCRMKGPLVPSERNHRPDKTAEHKNGRGRDKPAHQSMFFYSSNIKLDERYEIRSMRYEYSYLFIHISYLAFIFSSYYFRRLVRIDNVDIDAGRKLQSAEVGHIGQYFRMPMMILMPILAERRVVDEEVEIGIAGTASKPAQDLCMISATPRITAGGVSSNFGKCFFGITLTSKGRFEA